MEFDDRLRQAFDQLSARIREDVAGQLSAALAELSASVETDRTRAVEEATREARTVAEREAVERHAGSVTAAEIRARSNMESDETAASVRLLDAVRSLDRGHSLSEIMDVLALTAGAEASRAAIVLPAGSRFHVWRLVGFDSALDDTVEIELSREEAGIIADAAETASVARTGDATWSGSSLSSAPSFAQLAPDRPALAVPLVMSGHVFAVLYADQGPGGGIARDTWAATLEILARHAARSLEAVTAGRVAQLAENRSVPSRESLVDSQLE